MCGIAGVIGPMAEATLLHDMLDAIRHRGEEDHGHETWVAPGFAVGVNRLAIVDASDGRQPFANKDASVVTLSNGEIYNHMELREQLSDRFPFRTHCDTEAVLHTYQALGTAFTEQLNGMFALCVIDRKVGRVILARDPLGIKPLYYAYHEDTLYFGSECKALALCSGLEEIHLLPPGCMLCDGEVRRYYQTPPFATDAMPSTPDLGPIRTSLEAAVSRRLPPTDEPVSCLLSGGIDSSTVLYLAHKLHRGEVHAYTFAAPQMPAADLDSARLLCDQLAVPLHVISPEIDTLVAFYLDQGVYMTETYYPALVRNAVSYHYLCRAVVQAGYKFCLSGEGADEVFGGYRYFKQYAPEQRDALIGKSLAEIHQTYLQMCDRASMFATLEVRVPYMDPDLVATVLAQPPGFRIQGAEDKWSLRRLYSELPESIRSRTKTGMNAGAGYGSNDPGESIYFQGVQVYYRQTGGFQDDLALCRREAPHYPVDFQDEECVYNLAAFLRAGYGKVQGADKPLQLNTTRLQTPSLTNGGI